mgnify:FL=1
MKRGAAPKFRELGSSPAKPVFFGGLGAAIGGVASSIMGGKTEKEEEAAMLDEENKNKLAAEALEAKEKESIGYSEE